MTSNDTYVAEDNIISSATIYAHGANPAQALDRALNTLDRIADHTGRIASIETYTISVEYGDRYKVVFA